MNLRDDAIEVTGNGTASGPPDLVLLDLRLQRDADGVADALNQVSAATEAMLGAAREGHGLRTSRTQGLGVNPRFDQTGNPAAGFTAWTQVRLELDGTERVGDLIPALAAASGDAMSIDNLSLGMADPEPLLQRAREAAFGDARSRAEQFATLAGRTLGTVLAVVDSPEIAPGPWGRQAAFAKDTASGMPIEAGEHSVTATVTVRWALGVR